MVFTQKAWEEIYELVLCNEALQSYWKVLNVSKKHKFTFQEHKTQFVGDIFLT